MSGHTNSLTAEHPAPWKVSPGAYDSSPEASEFPHGPDVLDANDNTVACLGLFEEGIAAQISALPDLIAALRQVAILGHGKCTIGKPLAEMIRAALLKAGGSGDR